MTNTRTQQIEWLRNKVQELTVKGFTQSDICQILQLSKYTISRDIKFLREQAKEAIKNQIDEKLPYEFDKAVKGIEEIIKEAFIMIAQAEKTQDNKGKVTALSLAKDSIQTKMDLLTNAMLNDSKVCRRYYTTTRRFVHQGRRIKHFDNQVLTF